MFGLTTLKTIDQDHPWTALLLVSVTHAKALQNPKNRVLARRSLVQPGPLAPLGPPLARDWVAFGDHQAAIVNVSEHST